MNELHMLWYGYVIPSLYGNGPEAVIELIVVGIATALLVPPVRRWIVGKFQKVHDKLDAHHAELHAKLDSHHAEHVAQMAELHRKIDAQAVPAAKPHAHVYIDGTELTQAVTEPRRRPEPKAAAKKVAKRVRKTATKTAGPLKPTPARKATAKKA